MVKQYKTIKYEFEIEDFLIIIAFVCALALAIYVSYLYKNRNKTYRHKYNLSNINYNDNNYNDNKYNYMNPVLGHSTSSVDSERQFPKEEQWKGQNSKCYSCESEAKTQCGDSCVYNATKQKLFSVN